MEQNIEAMCLHFQGKKVMLINFANVFQLVSYPNFIRGLSFVDHLILASRLTVLNASYSAKQMIIRCFDQECE